MLSDAFSTISTGWFPPPFEARPSLVYVSYISNPWFILYFYREGDGFSLPLAGGGGGFFLRSRRHLFLYAHYRPHRRVVRSGISFFLPLSPSSFLSDR